MQIIDKYGYLGGALNYIERYLVSGRGLQKIAKKARINEDSLRSLLLLLNNFSEKKLLMVLQEKIENRHGSLPGADIEILGADISIESQNKSLKSNNSAFVLMNLLCDIVADGESEDKIGLNVKIFSKNNIQVQSIN